MKHAWRKCVQNFSQKKAVGKRPFGTPSRIWNDTIKAVLRKWGEEDRYRWRALVNTVTYDVLKRAMFS